MSEQHRGKIYEAAAAMCCFACGYGSLLAGILSIPFVFISIANITGATWDRGKLSVLALMAGKSIDDTAADDVFIISILHGLELLLLSPLPYLILSAIAKFVADWGLGKEEVSTKAHIKLNEAKILLYGSFTGLLGLDFIGKVVSNKANWKIELVAACGLLVITAVFFGLKCFNLLLEFKEQFCEKKTGKPVPDEPTPQSSEL